ncbi:MAG: TlpA disulfide reductase family protein [Bacteroidota bacterium]
MKFRFFLPALVFTMVYSFSLFSAEPGKIPSVNVKNLKGETINTSTFNNDGKPFLINFWATWCMPCIEEMKSLHEVYEDWQKETGIKIISVSIDDSRNSKKVAPFVKGRKWKFEFYLDENSDFKRAMNVNHPPHSFLCNGKGEIVWQHTGFAPGDEESMKDEINKVVAAEKGTSVPDGKLKIYK